MAARIPHDKLTAGRGRVHAKQLEQRHDHLRLDGTHGLQGSGNTKAHGRGCEQVVVGRHERKGDKDKRARDQQRHLREVLAVRHDACLGRR